MHVFVVFKSHCSSDASNHMNLQHRGEGELHFSLYLTFLGRTGTYTRPISKGKRLIATKLVMNSD